MLRLPPLNALRAFEAAARHSSFKRAAEELCVTPGAVSRHVAKLEGFLGVRLFNRRHAQVELTPAGSKYLGEIREAFALISQATARTRAADLDEGLLRIKAPPTCAARWLVPRLSHFHADHGDVSIQISTSHDPADFAQHVLLHSIRRPNDWPDWFAAAGVRDIAIEKTLAFENSTLTYQGAIDGLGVAIAQLAFVTDELEQGRLVAPVDFRLHGGASYHLVFPREKAGSRKIRLFHHWIAGEAALTRELLAHAVRGDARR